MESSVWMTVLIASIVYWGAFLVVMVVALLSSLKNKERENESNSSDNNQTRYERICWSICAFVDYLGGYIIFFACGILIGIFIKFLILKIMLFIPVWYFSSQFAHRVMPRIVNSTLGKLMGVE